jgi:hypothetical protein
VLFRMLWEFEVCVLVFLSGVIGVTHVVEEVSVLFHYQLDLSIGVLSLVDVEFTSRCFELVCA